MGGSRLHLPHKTSLPRLGHLGGIIHVFVDGDFAVKDGKQTDLRAGKVAKRS